MSEPQFIDNPESTWYPKRYDIITWETKYVYSVSAGMVIQMDTTSMNHKYITVKSLYGRGDDFYRFKVGTVTPEWHIIGKGTFYHKINHFVGFNIMLITTICIMILAIIILITCIGIIRQLLGFDPIFD